MATLCVVSVIEIVPSAAIFWPDCTKLLQNDFAAKATKSAGFPRE